MCSSGNAISTTHGRLRKMTKRGNSSPKVCIATDYSHLAIFDTRMLFEIAAQEDDDFKWDSEDEDEEQSPKDTSDNANKQPKSANNNDPKSAGKDNDVDKREDKPAGQKEDSSDDSDWE